MRCLYVETVDRDFTATSRRGGLVTCGEVSHGDLEGEQTPWGTDGARLAPMQIEIACAPRPALRFALAALGLWAVGCAGPGRTVGRPPVEMGLDPFYAKHVSASGYPIVASEAVDDHALLEAAYLVDLMLARRPDVREAMIESGSRLIVMGYREFTTDIPEYAHFEDRDYWDRRARGLGGSRSDPVCSCAEENVLAFPGDPYSTENILIHEFAHNIHLRGMVRVDETFDPRLKQAFEQAMAEGLWKGKYASTNKNEYFAEGVQSWFDDNREPDHDHNHVNTRRELVAYDPRLAALCEEVFGATLLVYTKPTTRLRGHLEGYDPANAPTFRWPERLDEVGEEILEKARSRGE